VAAMRALFLLSVLLVGASATIFSYEVILGNFVTTYYPTYPNTNKLPTIDFEYNGQVVATGLGYTQTTRVLVNYSDAEPLNSLWTIKATDATLYQPWSAVLKDQIYTQFTANVTFDLLISRGVDAGDGTPSYNYVFFPDYNGDGTSCAGVTTADTSTGVLIVNLGTGEGANEGFGNVNFATSGNINDNVGAGSVSFEAIPIYANQQQLTAIRINAAGKTWVNVQIRPVCGDSYMWVAYGDRQHQDQFPVHFVGPYSAAAHLAVSLPVLLLGLIVAFFSF